MKRCIIPHLFLSVLISPQPQFSLSLPPFGSHTCSRLRPARNSEAHTCWTEIFGLVIPPPFHPASYGCERHHFVLLRMHCRPALLVILISEPTWPHRVQRGAYNLRERERERKESERKRFPLFVPPDSDRVGRAFFFSFSVPYVA